METITFASHWHSERAIPRLSIGGQRVTRLRSIMGESQLEPVLPQGLWIQERLQEGQPGGQTTERSETRGRNTSLGPQEQEAMTHLCSSDCDWTKLSRYARKWLFSAMAMTSSGVMVGWNWEKDRMAASPCLSYNLWMETEGRHHHHPHLRRRHHHHHGHWPVQVSQERGGAPGLQLPEWAQRPQQVPSLENLQNFLGPSFVFRGVGKRRRLSLNPLGELGHNVTLRLCLNWKSAARYLADGSYPDSRGSVH